MRTASREDTSRSVAAYIDAHFDRFRAELESFLEIPSVSTDPAAAADVRRCAGWLVEGLRAHGFTAVSVPTAGHPVVLARHNVSHDGPTVLVYGHYDVQPSDPDGLWTSPPFRPTVRDGRIYARGAADDKGQVHMHLKTLESLVATGGPLPLNVILLLEGEEEVGSPNLARFVVDNREALRCDFVVISDTTMLGAELPCITTGMRGLLNARIEVRGPRRDLHSGHYGGAVVNPANALSRIVAALHDENGRITVPRFYDEVRALTRGDGESLRRLPLTAADLEAQAGVAAIGGETGIDAIERVWYRPALDVTGMESGFTGQGVKTIVPSSAHANVSLRLVADQDPAAVGRALEAHVRALAPAGVAVSVHTSGSSEAWSADTAHPAFGVAEEALRCAFGTTPLRTRVGGSIPVVPQLARALGVPLLLIGFSLPDSNIHAPDESLDLGVYRRGMHALAQLYEGLASLS